MRSSDRLMRNRPIKIMESMIIGGIHHHYSSRKTAEAKKASCRMSQIEGSLMGPIPNSCSPTSASMAFETVDTKPAAI